MPDLVVSSTALRAKTTAELFVENCIGNLNGQLRLMQDFYHASSNVYLDFLDCFDDEAVQTLMFVGHNPGLEDLVEQLGGSWEIMPTAAVAHFDLGVELWSEIETPNKAQLKNIWRPKDIELA